MTKDEERQIGHPIEEIDKYVDGQQWNLVKDIAERIWSVDPQNPEGIAYSKTAKRRQEPLQQRDTIQNPLAGGVEVLQEGLGEDSSIGRENELTHLKQALDRITAECG